MSNAIDNIEQIGNWKFIYNGKEFIKVINFPGEGPSESMWVEIVSGNDLEGVGRLSNHPVWSDLKHGDLVRYSGGSADDKPSYDGLAEEKEDNRE